MSTYRKEMTMMVSIDVKYYSPSNRVLFLAQGQRRFGRIMLLVVIFIFQIGIEETVADHDHGKEKGNAEVKGIDEIEAVVGIEREGGQGPEKEVEKDEIEVIDHKKIVKRTEDLIRIRKIEIVNPVVEVEVVKMSCQLRKQINCELLSD